MRVLRIPLALCLGILGALLSKRATASAVALRETHAHARTAYSQLLAVVAVVVNVEGSSRCGSRQARSSPPYVRPPLTRPSRRFGAWRADRDMTSYLRGRSEEGRRASRFNFPTRTSMAGRGCRLSGVTVRKKSTFELAGSLHYIEASSHPFTACAELDTIFYHKLLASCRISHLAGAPRSSLGTSPPSPSLTPPLFVQSEFRLHLVITIDALLVTLLVISLADSRRGPHPR